MGASESLLQIIDDRARKSTPETIVYRTAMKVSAIVDNFQAKVMIPGYVGEYTLLNKTGFTLSSGDDVIVESTGTSLNNGVIVYKHGKSSMNFEYELTPANLLTTIKTVDGSGSGLDADLLDGYHATEVSKPYNLTHITQVDSEFFPGSSGVTTVSPPDGLTWASTNSGRLSNWSLTSNHPGLVVISTALSPTANSGGALYTATKYSYLNAYEEQIIIFNLQETLAGDSKYYYVGRHNQPDGNTTVPTLGIYFGVIGGVLTGYYNTTATGTSYTVTKNTWYKIKMAVNSGRTAVTYTLYNASGTQLWTSTINASISTTTSVVLFAAKCWDVTAETRDLLLLDYFSYDITNPLTR